jgi:hypothetical protein
MERVRIIEHRGRQVVLLDFTGMKDTHESLAEIARAEAFFAQQKPDGSLLTVTDVTGSRYDAAILDGLKKLAAHNKPYVHAAAAVVQTAIHQVALNVAALFSSRKIQAFRSRDEALDWIARQ